MESLDHLLPGVIHDFNHLLTYIIGYTQLSLAKMGPEDRFRQNLERVQDAGKKAAELTRKLLSYSEQREPRPELLDLNCIVEAAGRLYQRVLGENMDIRWVLSRSPRIILADSLQIEQVLMNLILNACDAMPGGGKILLEAGDGPEGTRQESDAPPGAYVMLAVEDTGTGIPREYMDRIFEPYFTTKEPGRGTGLGLSTVEMIVRAHRGYAHVRSLPGKGTRFIVCLPSATGAALRRADALAATP